MYDHASDYTESPAPNPDHTHSDSSHITLNFASCEILEMTLTATADLYDEAAVQDGATAQSLSRRHRVNCLHSGTQLRTKTSTQSTV